MRVLCLQYVFLPLHSTCCMDTAHRTSALLPFMVGKVLLLPARLWPAYLVTPVTSCYCGHVGKQAGLCIGHPSSIGICSCFCIPDLVGQAMMQLSMQWSSGLPSQMSFQRLQQSCHSCRAGALLCLRRMRGFTRHALLCILQRGFNILFARGLPAPDEYDLYTRWFCVEIVCSLCCLCLMAEQPR